MKKPNILLLFPDQHRGDWMPYTEETFTRMGIDSVPINMPNVRRLMDEGITFTRTITSSPLCSPARACLASGLRYDKCQVPDNSYDYSVNLPSFYSVLKQNGYRVGGVGKFDLLKGSQNWGMDGLKDELKEIGFTDGIDNAGKWDAINSYCNNKTPQDPYMNYLTENNLVDRHVTDMERRKDRLFNEPTDLPEDAYCDNWLTDNGINLIKNFPEENPWFLQVNFTGPHNPWDVTTRMKEKWEGVNFPLPINWDGDPEKINKVRQNYAAMLENIDRNIGRLIDEIERREELDNTLIIYTADHGEMLGDFNKFGKHIPEQGSIHIPLVIWSKDINKRLGQKNTVSDTLVELQDLTATIVEYTGLEMGAAQDSISLIPVINGIKEEHRSFQVSALDDWQVIMDTRYKLVARSKRGKLKYKLYDLEEDPRELNNIANTHQGIVKKLSTNLNEELTL